VGDKYGLAAFQDLIMLEFLNRLEAEDSWLDYEEAKEGIENTSPQSALREVLVETVAMQVNPDHDWHELERLDGLGCIGQMVEKVALTRVHHDEYCFLSRFGRDGKVLSCESMWGYFMVGEGPGRHWVHKT
jgi:hypothetical protein